MNPLTIYKCPVGKSAASNCNSLLRCIMWAARQTRLQPGTGWTVFEILDCRFTTAYWAIRSDQTACLPPGTHGILTLYVPPIKKWPRPLQVFPDGAVAGEGET